MSHGNELPKVVDKSQAEIDDAIAAINESSIESSTKDFAISCIKLAVWLPKALLEQKIKLANLCKLIFGICSKNKKISKDVEQPTSKDKNKSEDHTSILEKKATASKSEISPVENQIAKPGHGRLPHSAYINTIEHQLAIAECKTGDPCPMLCNGKLYSINPGVIV